MKNLILIAALAFTTQAHAKLVSVYTSTVDGCAVYDSADLHKDAEIDFATQECAGLGGYQVMIKGGDLRYPLSLVYQKKEIQLTNFLSFNNVGSEKIEWLFERTKNGGVAYKALIHRASYAVYDEEKGTKDLEGLVVTKLAGAKTCAVALVKTQAKMNEVARSIAEKAQTLPCITINDETK